MPTKLDEADFSYWDVKRRLVAAAIGTPHPLQPYRQYAADRREYLREWGITIASKTRAYLYRNGYRSTPVDARDADGRQTMTYIPDASYGRIVPPTSGSTSEVEHNHRYPGTWNVVIALSGNYIAYLSDESITLSGATYHRRTPQLLDRWQRILLANAPGIRMRADNPIRPKDGGPDFDATLWTLNGASKDETHMWIHNHPDSERYIARMPSGVPGTPAGNKPGSFRSSATQLHVMDDSPYMVTMPRPESPYDALSPSLDAPERQALSKAAATSAFRPVA